MANPVISTVTLPSGSQYDISDKTARSQIENLKQTTTDAMHYVGTTTTALVDGATTSPIGIGTGDNSKQYTPKQGDVVVYGNVSYAWTGTQWDQYGSAGAIKALAYKDSASGTIKPSGTVSQPSFTGKEQTISADVTPNGTVKITEGTGTANYTPKGTVSVSPSVQVNTTTVNSITGVGSLPVWSATVSGENLIFSWAAGSLPTKGADTVVATGVKSATATGSFTGTATELKATFSGQHSTVSMTFTPEGTVGKPVFSGDEAAVTVK